MNIVILGSDGQLGKELSIKLSKSFSVYPLSRVDCDICNISILKKSIENIKPDIIINAAAYTNVDESEDNFNKANNINNKSLEGLSKISNSLNALLVHFSTDYVFNVDKKTPIVEETIKNPINKYGLTKHLGEETILKYCNNYFIFRISWVYGKFGDNFPKKIISLAKNYETLKVIDDQQGIPTSTSFIADALDRILLNDEYRALNGIYNLSPSGSCTWFEFATRLIDEIKSKTDLKLKVKEIIPVKSDEFATKAKRPFYSCLDNTKIKKTFKIKPFNWQYYLNKTVKDII